MSNQMHCVESKIGNVGNVVFLDIDGVLNNYKSMGFGEPCDIECARHVRRICTFANADIVVSSTWRIGNSTYNLQEILYIVGLNRVIGRTASNDPSLKDRGDEIKKWIDTYGCNNYVILDDDNDMLPEQKDNFIHVDGYKGITEEESNYAIRNIFKVDTEFCKTCRGYFRVGDNKCTDCNKKQYIGLIL
ncbi:hypothetical protein POP12_048 [Pectobacterium phage POP12]|nr:hypothetical protein POP12_048 [Pectobacterium phage POP12]